MRREKDPAEETKREEPKGTGIRPGGSQRERARELGR